MARKITFLKHASYLAQAIPAYILLTLFKLLPVSVISWLGGRIGRVVGLFHPGTRRAYKNLMLVLPEQAVSHKAIVAAMWDNLGRVMGEYARFRDMMLNNDFVEMTGIENVPASGPIVFLTGHMGNWEVCRAFAAQRGWDMGSVYRPLNNFYLDPLLSRLRSLPGQTLFPKYKSARELIRFIREGKSVGLVGDQRLSDGVSIPFFGIPALTSTMAALLAVRYGGQIVPAQVRRLENGRLHMTIHPVMSASETGTDQEKIDGLTAEINLMYESWIRQHPKQWLWMHDRWRPAGGWPKN